MRHLLRLAVCVMVVAVASCALPAQGLAQATDVEILMDKLIELGLISRTDMRAVQNAIELDKEAAVRMEPAEPAPSAAFPSWMDGLKQKGDLRLRWETQEFEDEVGKDRNRARFRLRWGLEKKYNDQWKAGFRLSSGNQTSATSTNQTIDNEMNFKDILINQAYAIYSPTEWASENICPHIAETAIGAGKFANPWKYWTTSLIWDGDVEPEGAYEKVVFRLTDIGVEEGWDMELQSSQFILDESAGGNDIEVLAYGAGLRYTGDNGQKLAVRATYYDWQDYADLISAGTGTLAVQPAGNDTAVSDFKVGSLYGYYKQPVETIWGEQKFKAFFQYINNTEEGGSVAKEGENEGYAFGVSLGSAKKKGTWQGGYEYYLLEANATPGIYVDGDFARGGTNDEVHKWYYKYMLLDDLQFGSTFWLGQREEPSIVTGARNNNDDEIFKVQLDLIYKF